MIFDTHAHYDDKAFDRDREELLTGLVSHGIDRVANVGVDIPTCEATLSLADKYDFIYAVIGFHPSDVRDMPEENLDWLADHLHIKSRSTESSSDFSTSGTSAGGRPDKVVAVGEIGLDYHWAEADEERRKQKIWFRRQIEIAENASLPIVIHSREAAADTMEIVRETDAGKHGGIIHCYSYSAEQAVQYVGMGFHIGVGGVITFKNSRKLRETVDALSLDDIVLETDCPYLAPEPHRGGRNDSTMLKYVVPVVADIKQVTEEEVIERTTKNALKVYGLE